MNQWEGCCNAAGQYYAVWPKAKADNDYEMLQTLGSGGVTQRWCFYNWEMGWYEGCNEPDSSPPIP